MAHQFGIHEYSEKDDAPSEIFNSPNNLSTKREIKTPKSSPKLNNSPKTSERKLDEYMTINQIGMSSTTSSLTTEQSGRNSMKHTDTINREKRQTRRRRRRCIRLSCNQQIRGKNVF